MQTSLNHPLNTLKGAFVKLVFLEPLKDFIIIFFFCTTQPGAEDRETLWFLSVLCLVGGENLSRMDFLGSFCYNGCLKLAVSGRSSQVAVTHLTASVDHASRQSPLTAV